MSWLCGYSCCEINPFVDTVETPMEAEIVANVWATLVLMAMLYMYVGPKMRSFEFGVG